MIHALNRRTLIGAALAAPMLSTTAILRAAEPDLSSLSDLTNAVKSIDAAERAQRIARAQEMMRVADIAAVVIEPGASLTYFTGVKWSRSERVTAAVIPREGEALIVTPFFEEPSVRETLDVPAEVHVWQEDESPLALIAAWLKERKLTTGKLGIEETARFFVSDGLGALLPGVRIVSANPIVRAIRMIKTPAEITLMQAATDVTIAAYRWTWPRVEAGMTGKDVSALMNAATQKLGGEPLFSMALVGEAAAYPHGSRKVHRIAPGEVLLMDCGCSVRDYESDVSRTFSYRNVRPEVRKVWDQVAKGQQIAFAAAKIGAPAGTIDDAVRGYYESLGYGPRYRLPGLSHRTGHGIGMDGHEPINLVHGETTKLAAGMCFSDEPGLYLPGKFGVRLEDCLHMTDAGPKWFSEPPKSIDAPI
ncbi:Xaa-Pro peptidase family protein [Sphingomonas sp. SUN019]|uniref:M24 family metallopeptidase n=1 Tax=Sphingomonas sp. SUN019 TaxID=2937788 RepID=UPI0021648B7F|nr:Xaa-Pro peptidase family protein [Sphingomonas sp. SUN019]UVO49085.1 Xaa-Pro peptidase family protein [Sphingomonas sp. SUN019]